MTPTAGSHIRRIGAAATLMGAFACGQAPSTSSPVPTPEPQTWEFTTSVSTSTGSIPFRGRFTAVQDTLLLTVEGADCRPEEGALSSFRYECPSLVGTSRTRQTTTTVSFSFQRYRPSERPAVAVSLLVQTTQTTCTQYVMTAGGARSCVRATTETVEVPESRSAFLSIRPVR